MSNNVKIPLSLCKDAPYVVLCTEDSIGTVLIVENDKPYSAAIFLTAKQAKRLRRALKVKKDAE